MGTSRQYSRRAIGFMICTAILRSSKFGGPLILTLFRDDRMRTHVTREKRLALTSWFKLLYGIKIKGGGKLTYNQRTIDRASNRIAQDEIPRTTSLHRTRVVSFAPFYLAEL